MSAELPPHRTKVASFVAGARPRTLPAAIVPVAVGTGVAQAGGHLVWSRSAAALVVALAIQIGTNYANDYSDGIRGTDAGRVGPLRLVASGVVPARQVKAAAWLSYLLAGVAGLWLAIVTTPYLIPIGAACLAAGWLYTGGPRPYGYAGLGEVFVFVFFGLVAVVGTAYVSLLHITGLALAAAIPVGLLAVDLLVVNNLRDMDTDARSGKRTLAVRLGDGRTRNLYEACLAITFGAVIGIAVSRHLAAIACLALVFAAGPVKMLRRGAKGRNLIRVLSMTGRLQLVLGILLAIGIAL